MDSWARFPRRWTNDRAYCALTVGAQHLHQLLLRQPDITKCGVLPYLPERLARQAADLTAAHVDACTAELVEHEFVLVDHTTDEVAVLRYLDLNGIDRHPQSLKRAAVEWRAIHSPAIRAAVVDQVPAVARDDWPARILALAPAAIASLLRGDNTPDSAAPPLPFPKSTTTADAMIDGSQVTVGVPPVDSLGTTSHDRLEREMNVLAVIVERRIARAIELGTVIHNPQAYRRTVVDNVRSELWIAIQRAVVDNPHLDLSTIADLLDHRPARAPRVGCADCDDGIVDGDDGPAYCPNCHPLARR